MKTTVLFGSETGNAESLAELAVQKLQSEGLDAELVSMDAIQAAGLAELENILIITSTWGDGEPPTNAYALWEELEKQPAIDLSRVRFAVLALGDTAYPEFCKCGRDFDEWLEALGGKRMLDRVDCDLDYEAPYATWINNVVQALSAQPVA